MEQKIVKVAPYKFTGDDGKEMSGMFIYLVPADSSSFGKPERIFMASQRLENIGYKPMKGDTVYVFRNDDNKVIDIVKT